MRIRVLEGGYAVCRLGALEETPPTPERGAGFWSLTEVGEERSLVCLEDLVDGAWADGATVVRGWRILEVLGPLDLGLTGVMAALAAPLADAGVPIFPIATHDTDWILVPGAQLGVALDALRGAGHETTG
ncbi:MAG TPA: ACT domain-containing protein [Baekduia sp.]|uniref:ACT domain-containing protein n=1 Tax=Baekduia sp. TaxID=2600305 RepID=UPI002D7926CA|nr:ACT domain-containing protein [Baekduia sp.]HET6508428.1 ACT domain-containing protein [Baekduia sp.]